MTSKEDFGSYAEWNEARRFQYPSTVAVHDRWDSWYRNRSGEISHRLARWKSETGEHFLSQNDGYLEYLRKTG